MQRLISYAGFLGYASFVSDNVKAIQFRGGYHLYGYAEFGGQLSDKGDGGTECFLIEVDPVQRLTGFKGLPDGLGTDQQRTFFGSGWMAKGFHEAKKGKKKPIRGWA